MNTILKIIGNPKPEDLSYLSGSQREMFLNMFTKYRGKNLKLVFKDATDDCIHLVKKMLEFNPYFRFSIDD